MDDIINEAKELVDMGIKELVVIGQDTTAYGIDLYKKYELHTLLSRLANETDVKWLRILYCYPDKITPELINEFKTNDKLVKYIDIPIQHINTRILEKMNRRGDGDLVRSVIKELRGIEGMTIRTTAIVGFPTETEEEFTELCEFIKEAELERFGAFTYSREEHTPAYNFEGQIDEEIKQERYDIIMRTQSYVSEKQAKNALGSVLEVIYEGYDPILEKHKGRDYKNAPEIDGVIFFDTKSKHEIGDFIKVKITDFDEEFYDLIGEEI
jgi:ribosomal protein S12 methylthiotransferase